ncbi:fructosamine kinase family protein [Flammeovirga agarivorans]|uniref:Fructosamine kinase family protein n=1 Tax=Flammeovirga agarivorans TaxID=2726742 RepID=A0A7X8SJG4_9BACT|nr:fructosamine kinase family protein [Flammeovirga agarivorans]NLR91300.1 fructosamine kinase family protein [Flammeovirga agarivorans]
MNTINKADLYQKILNQHFGNDVRLSDTSSITGGCINESIKLDTNQGSFFIKHNNEMPLSFFEAERKGLELLKKNSSFTVPNVLALGEEERFSYLILEYVESKRSTENYWKDLGEKLAEMHQVSSVEFGLDSDNYIGKLPQSNTTTKEWLPFFIHERLLPQVHLGIKNGFLSSSYIDKIERLSDQLKGYFPIEQPSFLHGDLWSGNTMVGSQGEPCLIDPAIYFGHRESELAFTTMFGGFDESFFHAYYDVFPWEEGIKERLKVYNLYPLLVHLNLFGRGYLSEIEDVLNVIDKF